MTEIQKCEGCGEDIVEWPHVEKVWPEDIGREFWHTGCFSHAHPPVLFKSPPRLILGEGRVEGLTNPESCDKI